MHCDEIRAQLFVPERPFGQDVQAHLASCTGCAAVARFAQSLDVQLRSSLLAEPPAELKVSLKKLALAAAPELRPTSPMALLRAAVVRVLANRSVRPAAPTGRGAGRYQLDPAFTVSVVQAIAVILLTVGAWLVWQLVGLVAPIAGDVPLAVSLVASSPVRAFLPDMTSQIQPVVGVVTLATLAWLVLDGGFRARSPRTS